MSEKELSSFATSSATPRVDACLRLAPQHQLAEIGQHILITPAPQLLDLAKQLERELADCREILQRQMNDAEEARLELAQLRASPSAIEHKQRWIPCAEQMPADDTPVFVLRGSEVRLGERRWERPTWEETFTAYRYWDDPSNYGQEWADQEITHWMPIPEAP